MVFLETGFRCDHVISSVASKAATNKRLRDIIVRDY